MKFVLEHLSSHHFFHAPHKWFLAILLSPVHAAQMHYERRYHLRFRHAKKLFFFDLCLIAFLLFLFGATLFWHFYDPTVRSLVSIKVEQSQERIKTGTQVAYRVSYINRSDVSLKSPVLTFTLPQGFLVNTSTAPENFQRENSTLTLSTLHPGGNGTFTLEGTLLGSPDQEYDTVVKLSYIQEGEVEREYVIARLISSPRDSPLTISWDMNNSVLSHGTIPFEIKLKNTGPETLSRVQVPLPLGNGIHFQSVSTSAGTFDGKIWELSLSPNRTSTLQGNLVSEIDANRSSIDLETIPLLLANGQSFPQKKLTKSLNIVRPLLEASAYWKSEKKSAQILETLPLSIRIKNTGSLDLQNISLRIPIPALINKTKIKSLNPGTVNGNVFLINKNQNLALARLKSGDTFEITLQIPLASVIEGTDIRLIVNPEIHAEMNEVPGAIYTKTIHSDALNIASHIPINAALRYYTDEGDQLGRGPLPPQVGQETRYFVTLNLENTTSKIENVQFSATLAPGFLWADKSSVSLGKDIEYNEATRKISWTTPSIPAHTRVGISFGIIFIPNESQIGTSPTALQNISLRATDSFTTLPLLGAHKPLDISLPTDPIGKNKGTKVIE